MSTQTGTSQAFEVARTAIGQVAVLTPSGSLTYETCQGLREALLEVTEQPRSTVVLDCRSIHAMDSEALDLLLEWHTRLAEQGGSLSLAGMNDVCSDIMLVSRLTYVFSIYEDVAHALRQENGR